MPTVTSTTSNNKPSIQRVKLNLSQQNQQTYRDLNTWKLKKQAEKIEKMHNNKKNNSKNLDNMDYEEEELPTHYSQMPVIIPPQAYYDKSSILAFSKLQTLNKRSMFRNTDPSQSYLNEFLLNDNGKPISLSHGKRSISFNSKLNEVPYNKNMKNFNKIMRNYDDENNIMASNEAFTKTNPKNKTQHDKVSLQQPQPQTKVQAKSRIDHGQSNNNNNNNNNGNFAQEDNTKNKNATQVKVEKTISNEVNNKQSNVKQQQKPTKVNQKDHLNEIMQIQTSNNTKTPINNNVKLQPIQNKTVDKSKSTNTTPTNKNYTKEVQKRELVSEPQGIQKKQLLPQVKSSKVPKTNVPVSELIKLKQNKLRSRSSEEISDQKASNLARSLTPIERKLDEVIHRLDEFDKFRTEFANSQTPRKIFDKKTQKKEFAPKLSNKGNHDDSLFVKNEKKSKSKEQQPSADFDFLSDVDDISLHEANLRNNIELDPELKFKRITPNNQFSFDKYGFYNSNNNNNNQGDLGILKNYGIQQYQISNNFSEENRSESILSKMYHDQHSNQKTDQGKYSNNNSTVKRNKTYNGAASTRNFNK